MNTDQDWQPHQFPGEKDLFDAQMARTQTYLEYGMGGSTIAAFERGISRIVSVDSDPVFVQKVRERVGGDSAKIQLIHCDIGRVAEWGMPIDQDQIQLWPNYFSRPWQVYASENIAPDLVYIDGRFRVACVLYSLIMLRLLGRSWFRRAPRLMLHDFSSERPHYNAITEFASIVAHENTLIVLQPKMQVSLDHLIAELLKWQFDPR